MSAARRTYPLTLLQNWPRRVRSAIDHAVSMANVALTTARGRAEHHFDTRVRLGAEYVRLEQEIALLRVGRYRSYRPAAGD